MMLKLFFSPIFLIKMDAVGTHMNRIDKLMQFRWVPITYAFIKKTLNTQAVI